MTGKQLARLLAQHNVTQRELAARLGVTEAAVSLWVSDRRRISVRTEMAIRFGLDTSAKIVSKRARTGSAAAKRPRKSLKARG